MNPSLLKDGKNLFPAGWFEQVMNLNCYRDQIPALNDAVYLNTGTFGPSPTAVFDEIRQALNLIERHGPYSPEVREALERQAYEQTRLDAADLIGAHPEEIILTRSASDGINTIAFGLDWRPGDEVVISSEEHQSGTLPWFVLSRRFGVKVRIAKLDPDPAVTLQNIDDCITARTRLVFFSHVSCISGIRAPAAEICKLAHDRGALAVLDGAHALGQFPVGMAELGCDAYIGCGHKWLLGPQGTSFAYLARQHLEIIQPSWIGWGAQIEGSIDLDDQSYTLHDSARRFEFGTKQWPLFSGLGKALRFMAGIGTAAIEDQVRPLARELKLTLDRLNRWERLTPIESERSAGIVTIRLGPATPVNIKQLLWDSHRLLVAYFVPHRTLRISVAFFTKPDELERAVEALKTLDLI
jgi:selenocysteine lyase/cysteine desulfurase